MRGWSDPVPSGRPPAARRAGWLASVSLSLWCAGAVAAAPPNIVLIMADDLGWQDVGFHGGPLPTPRIDQIATSGIVLDRFYVQPICSPTRAEVMTGRSSAGLGVIQPIAKINPGGLPLSETLLPEVLAAAGYQTLMVGKWHLGHGDRRYFPHERGFEHFYGHVTGGIGYWDHNHGGGHDWQRNGVTQRETGYATRLLADEAVRLLAARDRTRPTFLFASFNAPHLPNEAPAAAIAGAPASGGEQRRVHLAMVAELDHAVGRILDAIAAEGMRDDTLVWFFSDNGGLHPGVYPAGLVTAMRRGVEWFGEPLPVVPLEFVRANVLDGGSDNGPLRAGKTSVYEGGIRVPAALWWPGHTPPGVSEAFVTARDVLPTLLQAAQFDAALPAGLDGVGRWSAIVEGEGPTGGAVPDFRVEGLDGVALLRPPWKLVVPAAPLPWLAGAPALYHLVDDPSEREDLAGAFPDRVAALQAVLETWPLGPSIHVPLTAVVRDPDSFGGPEDRGPWAEAAR